MVCFLSFKVGHIGLLTAAGETSRKLLKRTAFPRLRSVIQSPEDQWTIEQILAWRGYLGVNLDQHPENIIHGAYIPRLAQQIVALNAAGDYEAIAALLEQFRVPDKFVEAAKLLVAYLDTTGNLRLKMRDVICHRCNSIGHVVRTY